uniref:Protein sel-1 homolog 3-like n=1 Tax=Lepisosteus oculatus TaxID=7918 RepID=W5MMM0_LEPOC|nr:PREDICTED: protein sel-1 homolog 3-like [Lepisosteus oculatus]
MTFQGLWCFRFVNKQRLKMKALIFPRCVPLLYLVLFVLLPCGADSLQPTDEVVFLNPPEEPVSGYSLQVLYSCSHTAVVHLEALASSESRDVLSVFHRRWSCRPGPSQIRVVSLDLPDWLVYRADWKIRGSAWVLSVMLRVWVTADGIPGSYQNAAARALIVLHPVAPYVRPMKVHQLCPRWDVELLWKISKDDIPQCQAEEEVSHFLTFVYASTGENFGIIRTLKRYSSKVLERLRQQSISFPWCVFSIWIYMTQPCKQHFCGLLHHVDANSNYASPVIFITDAGLIHVQLHGKSEKATAFLSTFRVPRNQWCRIDTELKGNEVTLRMKCSNEPQYAVHITSYTSMDVILLDDTDGFFVLGGGQFVRGIEGFYGPAVYYRNRLPSVSELPNTSLPDPIKSVNLTGWFNSCWQFKQQLLLRMNIRRVRSQLEQQSDDCVDVYSIWIYREERAVAMSQCFHWEGPVPKHQRLATRLIETLAAGIVLWKDKLRIVGRALYSQALRRLTREGGTERIRVLMPLLLQAGCLGDNRALFLGSVLYHTDLGIEKKPSKALLLSLLAAQQDWRLALLRLGHLHHTGEPGFPLDLALAYAYYSNIAAQTSSDQQDPSPKQVFVESVFLNEEDVLKLQTHENDDLFFWLKFQAQNGVVDAQQALGRMLFWGQQGVSPDLRAAVKYYERGAIKLEDPVSMYDYAIVLLKGQGVEQDIPKAVKFLKKAAQEDFVPAINALGWYYEQYEQDYKQAVELWERADSMGSPEAALNLGVLHSQGLYPGKPIDQFKAYTCYLRSAQRGHIDGAIQLAQVWMQGIPGRVSRVPLDAVRWAKWASEQNGYLGAVLRKALGAYLRQDWSAALIHYLMAAESGFTAAQFNVGYLCEHNHGGLLSPAFVSECMWRYYNLSTQSQDPVPYALIKMGDLFYAGHKLRKRDVGAAAELYKQAALRNDPQGWYSLGLLVQEGVALPGPFLVELDLSESHRDDNYTLLTALYRRCRDHEDDDSYLPCSLALLSVHLQFLWNLHSATLQYFTTVALAIISILTLLRLRGAVTFNGQAA